MPGTFPTLKTGAVSQYPLLRELRWSAEVLEFLDGSQQAYRREPAARRRWSITLDVLDDAEIALLKDFFEQQKGAWSSFAFTDPFTGVTYANCSFASDVFPHVQTAENRNSTRLVVYEHP